MKNFILYSVLILTSYFVEAQNIEIRGNSIIIANDGSNIPDDTDDTDFGDVLVGDMRTHTFTITNLEQSNPVIQIRNISANSSEFIVTTNLSTLKPGKSGTFDVTFQPVTSGLENAIISIEVKRRNSTIVYTFNIRGSGTKDIMITQYYENVSSDKIELKNISKNNIENGRYFLAIYYNGTSTLDVPDFFESIGNLAPGEVKTFGNTGYFDGTETIVISTSSGTNCFSERVDIIGDNTTDWGSNISFTKGGCASELPHLNFDINDWIEVSIEKVDKADHRKNIAIGTYNLGSMIWNSGVWSGAALPDLSRIVIIEDLYSANDGNIEACNLIVNSDLNFEGGTNNSIVVYGDLTINGTLTIGDTESLVMYNDTALIIGKITKNESSTFRNNAHDITYWSSPVSDAEISTVFDGVNPGRIFLYDQSKTDSSDPDHPDYWNTWISTTGPMINGKAYAAEGRSGTTGVHDLSFTGTANNGIINVEMEIWDDNDEDNDFNLIGNPYPSAIDIETFFSVNSSLVDSTIYLWTHTTPLSGGDSGDFVSSDYATYNLTGGIGVGGGPEPDKNIGSGQGFFIRAIRSGNIEFNNSMRIEDANNQFYKSDRSGKNVQQKEEKDRIWLNLTTNKGGFNQLLIGFMEKATEKVDRNYDALKINGGNRICFYSNIENKKYAIQGLNTFSVDKSVNLGFDTNAAPRTFTIGIGKTEGELKNSEVYLFDNKLQITHDLKQGDYQFEQTETGEFINRFTLQFVNSALSVDQSYKNDEFVIVNLGQNLEINAKQVVNSVRVYDIMGREIINARPQNQSFVLSTEKIKKGTILIIHALMKAGPTIIKKTIKY